MNWVVFDLLLVILGFAIVAFHKSLARDYIKQQNRLFKFNFGEREEKSTRWVVLLVGVFFIVAGTLSLMGVIR